MKTNSFFWQQQQPVEEDFRQDGMQNAFRVSSTSSELLLCSPLPSLSNNKSLDERTKRRSQKSREAWESKVGKGS